MDRVHIPNLTIDEFFDGEFGWFMDTIKVSDDAGYEGDKRYPVFSPPCCHPSAMTNHTIDAAGEVNASILCHCGQYHVFGVFDGWPNDLVKDAGSLTVRQV